MEERNYFFFLKRYADFMTPVVDTFAYCLLGNHFHLLIRVKSEHILKQQLISEKREQKIGGLHSTEHIASKQFARLFSSYTQTINKAVGRTGALIETPFERKEVNDEEYFTRLIWYIHHNPQKHRLISDFRHYPYSSYRSHLSTKPTRLVREYVLAWFGGVNAYTAFHEQEHDDNDFSGFIME
ncbi:hypothetical protein GCM10027190_17500 [Spirosoma areae]